MTDANLILAWQPGAQAQSDFDRIAEIMRERAPDIAAHVIRNGFAGRSYYDRESLSVCMNDWRGPEPARGPLYRGKHFGKWREYELFRDAGIPIPETVILKRGTTLDPSYWGGRVVLKPIRGYQGRGITLEKTSEVRWRDPRSWPSGSWRHGKEILVQRFIDTGDPVTKYRVLTLFGRALFSILQTAPEPMKNGRFTPNMLGGNSDLWSDANDPDVLDLASRAFGVLPGVACLAVDILRDKATGKLWLIEANPRGNSWHLSSGHGRRRQQAKGYDLYKQFDALSVAADALISATRREAA